MTKMTTIPENYNNIRAGIVELLKAARCAAARNVNSLMTATYWEIGRRIVQSEQAGEKRAEYGEVLIKRLAKDLIGLVWQRFWVAQPRPNEELLSGLAARQRFCRHCLKNLQHL